MWNSKFPVVYQTRCGVWGVSVRHNAVSGVCPSDAVRCLGCVCQTQCSVWGVSVGRGAVSEMCLYRQQVYIKSAVFLLFTQLDLGLNK